MAGNYWEMPGGGKIPPNSTCEMRSNIHQISDFDFGQVRLLFWQNLAIVWMGAKEHGHLFFQENKPSAVQVGLF